MQWCPAAGPFYTTATPKNPTKKAEAKGGPARAHTEGTRIESESGHRVGEVGHPDWNEPNGTENVSSRWTRPSPISPPKLQWSTFSSPATWRRQGREKGLEGCCDSGEHINFSNLSNNIKAPRFIFQRRLTTILLPSARAMSQQHILTCLCLYYICRNPQNKTKTQY